VHAGDPLAERFTIDDRAGELTVLVKKKGALKAFAHDHDIVARVYSGSIAWVSSVAEASSVQLEIETKELIVRDQELSDDDRTTVQKHMRNEDVLDVDRFPKITFSSESAVVHPKDLKSRTPLSVRGTLTVHGVARKTTLEVLLEDRTTELVITGEHALKQSDHGIEPYSAAFGALAVEDTMTIRFRIVARRQGGVK
jgi:polyisoprenoid-binding protein YceI